MTSHLNVVEEAEYPALTTAYSHVTGNYKCKWPNLDSKQGSVESQRADRGNAVDHAAFSTDSKLDAVILQFRSRFTRVVVYPYLGGHSTMKAITERMVLVTSQMKTLLTRD